MNQFTRLAAALGVALALAGSGSRLWAQDPTPPVDPPVEPESAPEAPASEEPPPPREKHFGLYVGVAVGAASGDDVETSIETTPTTTTRGFLTIDEADFGRAAIGWQLPANKGDFRLVFNGYKETSYQMTSTGLQNFVNTPAGPQFCVAVGGPCLVPWWLLEVDNGAVTARRFPPTWDLAINDADNDGSPDIEEVVVLQDLDLTVNSSLPDSLQNQIQTVDLLYGRAFGGRRYSSHWWGGLRGFEYRGNTIASAWLLVNLQGTGFTEGALLRLLNVSQDTNGFGPTGAWEVDFNFFDRRLALYVKGQVALMFNSTTMDTGNFYTLADVLTSNAYISAPARLREERDKSTWQNGAELGARYMMRNGLQFELGYSIIGYLDAVLTPVGLTIPANETQVEQGTSGLLHTQDLRFDGWHAGLAFQF